ncbi:uncharacterized protein FIBRA_04035 [Fibroporia radiculosa]|uniref:DUF7923 domain-containing protein n=1 Tax=Fibroporia radiculosa TaxID=599839 RepID=J4HWB3_9APHY|nr:uncharacterized protein FIBRA_04035 [Fibroporia radiculosa]CCM01962.1 predicted protein [Fibroporia radiculosa]
MLLTKGLTDHLASIESPDATLPGRGQLWLTIYCNKAGLLETLTYNNVCSVEQFEDFVIGFNQASPLFSIVDVGIGKEAADAKVKECLRVFTRFPQTSKVFFGGSHDNGYTSTLTHLHNEGFSDKIILLRGYKQLAYEIKGLDLPNIEIEGLFMKKKLYTNSSKKGSSPNQRTQSPNEKAQSISQSMPPPDIEKYRSKSSTPSMMDSGSPTRSLKHVDFDQVLSKRASCSLSLSELSP